MAEQSWKAALPCVTPAAPPAAAARLSNPTADVQARKTAFEASAARPPWMQFPTVSRSGRIVPSNEQPSKEPP